MKGINYAIYKKIRKTHPQEIRREVVERGGRAVVLQLALWPDEAAAVAAAAAAAAAAAVSGDR